MAMRANLVGIGTGLAFGASTLYSNVAFLILVAAAMAAGTTVGAYQKTRMRTHWAAAALACMAAAAIQTAFFHEYTAIRPSLGESTVNSVLPVIMAAMLTVNAILGLAYAAPASIALAIRRKAEGKKGKETASNAIG